MLLPCSECSLLGLLISEEKESDGKFDEAYPGYQVRSHKSHSLQSGFVNQFDINMGVKCLHIMFCEE